MRAWSQAFVGLTLFVACSSASPSPPVANDATLPVLDAAARACRPARLRVDGLFVFDSFFDAQLGVACDRDRASDGSDRCVPQVDACAAPSRWSPARVVAFTSTSEVPSPGLYRRRRER